MFSLHMDSPEAALADWHGDPVPTNWHGDPVPTNLASDWLNVTDNRNSDALARLVARYWAGLRCDVLLDELQRNACNAQQTALIDLVWGQLLMARRLEGAMAWLNRGFNTAAPFLSARDYLRVLKRHQTLNWLILDPKPSPPLTLPDLIRLADVTRRLRAANGEDARFAPDSARRPQIDGDSHREDTLG
ncbi:MAG: hypothetical protein KDI42_03635 [Gammaproteobacteria bacterium]|nr:hypothetical protein [Gammaproteobacteria bacterium]